MITILITIFVYFNFLLIMTQIIFKLISDITLHLHFLLLFGYFAYKGKIWLLMWFGHFLNIFIIEKILKPYFKKYWNQVRPNSSGEGGMPSGHVAAVAYILTTYLLLADTKFNFIYAIIYALITILIGVSRYSLNYHTWQQLVGGSIYGIISACIYFNVIKRIIK